MPKNNIPADVKPVRYFKEQFDDESTEYVFRKHPVVMRRGLIYSAMVLVLPMLLVSAMSVVYASSPEKLPTVNTLYLALVIGILLGIIVFLPYWISWYYTVYIVTDQRLVQIGQKGLFNRSIVAIGLEQVQMVNYEVKGVEQTFLSFGTLVIQTTVGSLTINDVLSPAKVQKRILGIMKELDLAVSYDYVPIEEEED